LRPLSLSFFQYSAVSTDYASPNGIVHRREGDSQLEWSV
jgi:hypothetical protein